MKNFVRQGFSFILPITVLILVPLSIEKELSIKCLSSSWLGILIICGGFFLMFKTISAIINIGDGTLAPWNPTTKLVTSGMYGYVRNPMILGVLTVLVGESITILSQKILIWAIVFFMFNNLFFVLFEEPNLKKKFGDQYVQYKKSVPRWIPNLKPFKSDSIS